MLFLEILLGLLLLGTGLLILFFVGYFLFWVAKLILFRFHYGPIKESIGKVIDMEFEESTYNVATKTTDPEKNLVTFKTKQGTTQLDSDTLYQRVRIGEDITVKYQDIYREPRFWNGDLVFDGMRLISIVCYRDQEVEFNDIKDTSKKLAMKLEMCEICERKD